MITIIVLLILAGVSIAMLTGQNGILTQAQRAKNETENAQADEENTLANYEQYIEGSTNGGTLTTVTGNETTNTKVKDSLGNIITVPAGFRVVNPGDNVEDGIVIEDVNHEATAGSQFVWIPVGKIKTTKGEIEINLDRYDFSKDKNGITKGEAEIEDYYGYACQEVANSDYENIVARDLNEFIEKVNTETVKGFYIARYEARDRESNNPRTELTSDTNQIVIKDDNYIYNHVTQQQAASLSRNMYGETDNFSSDLINSYAWDTTIVFIQKCSEEDNYSQQISLNSGNLAEKGTKDDVVCNIYDMASNCFEWSTETSSIEGYHSVFRGGNFSNNYDFSSTRHAYPTDSSGFLSSFRPIIYLAY